ncbi:MAG: hypothetical protein IPJ01_09430 [Micavibrio sp.]|nr:hypothetical protein [Micavibrio sp.]
MTAFENWQVIIGIIQSCILLATCLAALWIGLKQNEINQNILNLQFVVALEVVYTDKKINIANKGQTNLFLWGTQTLGNNKLIEKEPRLITPGGFYYLNAEHIETEAREKLKTSELTVLTLDLFLKNQNQDKYVVRTIINFAKKGDDLISNSQTISVAKKDWDEN